MKKFRYSFRIRKIGMQYVIQAFDLMNPNDKSKGYTVAFFAKRPSIRHLLDWMEVSLNELFNKMAQQGDVESFDPLEEFQRAKAMLDCAPFERYNGGNS